MNNPRKVRGLIGAVEAELAGEAWSFEEPSEEYVPGMGLGATDEATRWAWLGYCVEQRLFIQGALARKRGRPPKNPIESKDAWRAFILWRLTRRLSPGERAKLTNRTLIEYAMRRDDFFGVPISERAFPKAGNHEASVSRGKRFLEIDGDWNSPVCEKLDRN